MAEVDAAAGEWRCRCPSDPDTALGAFDTSVNPSFIKACGRCGMKRPQIFVVEEALQNRFFKIEATPMPSADAVEIVRSLVDGLSTATESTSYAFNVWAEKRLDTARAWLAAQTSAPSSGAAKENHYFCMGCGVTLMPSWGMSCSPGCARIVRESMANNKEEVWEDRELPEDAAISAAHPMESRRFDLYNEAMRLVGAKQSKGALVDLVNWLLHGADAVGDLQKKASQYRKEAAEWEAKYNELRKKA